MNIGQQILDLIIHDGLVSAEKINDSYLFVWQGNAAEQLEALVESQYGRRPEPENAVKILDNMLACLDNQDALRKLSAKELIEECLQSDAADELVVIELMNRVLPGWENLP